MKKNKKTHFMAGVLMVLFVGFFLLITGRFLYIQITGEINNVSLKEWAEQKRTSSYVLESERGKIYDANGMPLAYDMKTYRLLAIVDESYTINPKQPLHVVDAEETAAKIAPILEVDESYILERIRKGRENGQFQVEFGSSGRELPLKVKEEIEALDLPGITFAEESIRFYPNGMFASHIIGFARKNQEEESDDIVGVTGIEREFNDILSGEDGFISYKRDKYNKKLLDPDEIIKKPVNGHDIYLTLDQKIQTLLEDVVSEVDEVYQPDRITAVVMSAKTGKILAMTNRPSYNPNQPDDVQNWYNDVISTPVEPGSTVKMFTWAAAIDAGVYNGSEGYQSGTYQINRRIQPIGDHNQGRGWGVISFDEGFAKSSNVAAAKLVWEKLGTEQYLEYLHAFDFDKPTGIDLPGEVAGKILYNWPLEKITTAFGQGSTMTPIQQVKAASAIANEGKMLKPYVIEKIVDSSTGEVIEEHSPTVVGEPIKKETAAQVIELLDLVVNSPKGTGSMYRLDDYTVVGKTGTAEIPNPDGPTPYLTGRENYIFSFLGMAPKDDPELIMHVSVKQPKLAPTEAGSAPVSLIFNSVMENSLHYLNIEPDRSEHETIESVKLPKLIGEDAKQVYQSLNEQGLLVTLVGQGEQIVQASHEEGDNILFNNRLILVTDEPTMPDIKGWSLRDVLTLADLLDLHLEYIGHGFVDTQSIEVGTQLKSGDYLGIELKDFTHDTNLTEEQNQQEEVDSS